MRIWFVYIDTWPAATRVLSRGRERTLGTRLARQGKKCIRITRSFIVHFRHALLGSWWCRVIYVVRVCNHRVAKQSKAGPPGAESSCGESTMLSTNFAGAICGKQAVKNRFLFVCGPRFRDLRFQDFRDSPAATKMQNVCHGHDCR